MTLPNSNAGVYSIPDFRMKDGQKQVLNVGQQHLSRPKKTASIYGVVDCLEAPANDDEWFDLYIKVDGKKVITKVNGKIFLNGHNRMTGKKDPILKEFLGKEHSLFRAMIPAALFFFEIFL